MVECTTTIIARNELCGILPTSGGRHEYIISWSPNKDLYRTATPGRFPGVVCLNDTTLARSLRSTGCHRRLCGRPV